MKALAILGGILFAALPQTNNYQLNSYSFGSGGITNSKTTTYSLEGSSGEAVGQGAAGNYQTKPGYIETQQANVPKITVDDGNGLFYNKLHFVIDQQSNPSDAKYLIAVSTDSAFTANQTASNVKYVQPDGTLSSTLTTAAYQTYAQWGGAAGSTIVGLEGATTYYVRAKATQGQFTESIYGPAATKATVAAQLSFDLVTSATSTPPYIVSLGNLEADTVYTTPDTINTAMTTNGTSGGSVYVTSKNGGLLSSLTGNKIVAGNLDLSSATTGFGAQNSSVSQTSGGPYSVLSPYNVSGTNVGIVSNVTRTLYNSPAPISNGAGKLLLKAKAARTDIAATDYQEILTFTAAGNF